MEHFAVWGGTLATAGNLVFYGTLDGFIKARRQRHRRAAVEVQAAVRRDRPSDRPISTRASNTSPSMYGVGGWPGVGLVFDLKDPTAGLGAVGAFKELAHYTQMGGGVMVFSLDGKGPYDDLNVGEYKPNVDRRSQFCCERPSRPSRRGSAVVRMRSTHPARVASMRTETHGLRYSRIATIEASAQLVDALAAPCVAAVRSLGACPAIAGLRTPTTATRQIRPIRKALRICAAENAAAALARGRHGFREQDRRRARRGHGPQGRNSSGRRSRRSISCATISTRSSATCHRPRHGRSARRDHRSPIIARAMSSSPAPTAISTSNPGRTRDLKKLDHIAVAFGSPGEAHAEGDRTIRRQYGLSLFAGEFQIAAQSIYADRSRRAWSARSRTAPPTSPSPSRRRSRATSRRRRRRCA